MVYSEKKFFILKVFFVGLSACLLLGGLMVSVVFMKILQLEFLEGAICSMTGIITLCLAPYGGYNAYFENRGKLICYIFWMSVVVLVQMTVGIFTLVHHKKEHQYFNRWRKQIGIKGSVYVLMMLCLFQLVSILIAAAIIYFIKVELSCWKIARLAPVCRQDSRLAPSVSFRHWWRLTSHLFVCGKMPTIMSRVFRIGSLPVRMMASPTSTKEQPDLLELHSWTGIILPDEYLPTFSISLFAAEMVTVCYVFFCS